MRGAACLWNCDTHSFHVVSTLKRHLNMELFTVPTVICSHLKIVFISLYFKIPLFNCFYFFIIFIYLCSHLVHLFILFFHHFIAKRLRLRVVGGAVQIYLDWLMINCARPHNIETVPTSRVVVTVLHDMQLTHTDLKPENILFVNSDSELEYDPKAVSACFHSIYIDVVHYMLHFLKTPLPLWSVCRKFVVHYGTCVNTTCKARRIGLGVCIKQQGLGKAGSGRGAADPLKFGAKVINCICRLCRTGAKVMAMTHLYNFNTLA